MGWDKTEPDPEQPQAESFIDSGALTKSGVTAPGSAVLRRWASSSPNDLPGGFADSEAADTSGVQHSQLHGLHRRLAVERSGSSIPMLRDDSDAAGLAPQALQPTDEGPSDATSTQLPAQQSCMPEGECALSGRATDLPPPSDPFQSSDLQPPRSTSHRRLQHRPPSQHLTLQQPNAHRLTEALSESFASQPLQVLRRRNRSRLQLTQGGVAKGIMSLGKHRSGKISPEKAALLPLDQESSFSEQQNYVESDTSDCESNAAGLNRHMKLSLHGLEAMLPNKRKSDAHVSATSRGVARKRSSMHEVLHRSLQQVQACTAQLQEQNTQQQQLQRSVKAMTARTAAMLDQAILAAVHAQQHNDA